MRSIQRPHVISGEAVKWAWITCGPCASFSDSAQRQQAGGGPASPNSGQES